MFIINYNTDQTKCMSNEVFDTNAGKICEFKILRQSKRTRKKLSQNISWLKFIKEEATVASQKVNVVKRLQNLDWVFKTREKSLNEAAPEWYW